MPKISTRVTFNKTGAAAYIKAMNQKALTDMGNQALEDVTQHVPKDQGTLRNSGKTNSDHKAADGKYTMRWAEPYSQYLWHGKVMYGNPANRTYGPKKLKFTDALAQAKWAEYAKDKYGAQWKKVYQAALKRRLRT